MIMELPMSIFFGIVILITAFGEERLLDFLENQGRQSDDNFVRIGK
jgi:hypothetical protein